MEFKGCSHSFHLERNYSYWRVLQAKNWELVDLGSLNGTLINGRVAHEPERQPGRPVALSNGDIVTLGSSSQLLVSTLAWQFDGIFVTVSWSNQQLTGLIWGPYPDRDPSMSWTTL